MNRRKLLGLTLAIAVLGLAIAAAGCGGEEEEAAPPPAEPAAPPAEEPAAPPAEEPAAPPSGEGFRAAVLFPGTENDGSWANAWADGAKAFAEETGATVEVVGGLNEPDQYLQQGAAFASQGYNLIVFAHGATGDAAVQLAKQFPDVQFCQSPLHPTEDALAAEPPNLCHLDFEQQNASFLAGVLAALVSKTGKVASVNGFAFPALTRQPEAFYLGARCVNPDIQFSQKYINSWEDTALAKAAAEAFIADGADVLLGATDQAVQGMYEAAREAGGGEAGIWIIPEYFDSNDQAPDVILTSVLFNIQGHSKTLLEAGLAGELGKGPGAAFFRFDLLDSEKLAPFYEDEEKIGADNVAKLQEIVQKLDDGTITVPDESIGSPTIGAEGDAANVDPASIGC